MCGQLVADHRGFELLQVQERDRLASLQKKPKKGGKKSPPGSGKKTGKFKA